MSGGTHAGSAIVGFDIRPIGELLGDGGETLGVGVLEAAQGFVGEDDAPSEGVVDPIAFVDGDFRVGQVAFGEKGCVQAPGATTDAGDFHGA